MPEDHQPADMAAIRAFMNDPNLELTYVGNKSPSNFTVGTETVIGNGAWKMDSPDEWKRTVNLYKQSEPMNELCEVYEYEIDARNNIVVEAHIRVLDPNELQHLNAIGQTCKKQLDPVTPITKTQAEAIATGYMKRGVPNYDSIKDQFSYSAITGKYAAHEWLWKDTGYKLPKGLSADPFPYPVIRIQISTDGKLTFYGNTVGLFKN